MPRDDATVLDMIVACRRIEAFLEGHAETQFNDDLKTQSAVLHQLLVIGEAVNRLSDNFIVDHPSIPWAKIRGMRNHLVHGYDTINIEEV